MTLTQFQIQGAGAAGPVANAADTGNASALHRETVPASSPARSQGGGAAVAVKSLSKRYGERDVLNDIDLDIAPGEFVSIVGRSGCGKSTLLRLLAGLETASEGGITVDGHALHSTRAERRAAPTPARTPRRDRPTFASAEGPHADIRIMFQDARLLPWKRVVDNVALGLPGSDAKARALEALAQVGLAERAKEWPAVLSGGQRQRVALARALVHTPRLLLLDEPLGALDALTRIEMHRLIERLWQRHGFTALLVTHDVSESVALADRVVLIEDHRIALDERIALPRPRPRGAAFAQHEEHILDRVLQQPARDDAGPATQPPPLPAAHVLRWAV